MDDYRWVVCFDTAMIIRNVYSTNEENAKSSVKYYRSIYNMQNKLVREDMKPTFDMLEKIREYK